MVQDNNFDSEFDLDLNAYEDWESEGAKVEIGDNYIVIIEELKDNDSYVVFYVKSLHECEATFTNGRNNTWY
jgi:hypothetical protein